MCSDRIALSYPTNLDEDAAARNDVRLGRGSISLVSSTRGLSRALLTEGLKIADTHLVTGRIRQEGGGRRSQTSNHPDLTPTSDGLV
jgi:hypothetical protein